MRRFRSLSIPYVFWALVFVLVPLGMIFYYGLTTAEGAFTLDNFRTFFAGNATDTLVKSLRIAFIATAICFILGYPMAYCMAQAKISHRAGLLMLVVIPMWMNFLLRTYAWITILSRGGILNTFLTSLGLAPVDLLYTETAVIIGMVYNFLPFMILPIYTSLEKMDQGLLDAAADLGANKVQAFWEVTFPLSIPGIASGLSMVFIPAIATFEITSLLGGNKTNLIGNVIQQQFTVTGNWNYGSSMALILLVFLVLSLIFGREEQVEPSGAKVSAAVDAEDEEVDR